MKDIGGQTAVILIPGRAGVNSAKNLSCPNQGTKRDSSREIGAHNDEVCLFRSLMDRSGYITSRTRLLPWKSIS